MSKKQSGSGNLPAGLPDDFFDLDKKNKKAQEDELTKELEQFEKEMAALQAESEEQLKEEFDKLQDEKNLEELDQQLGKWKQIIELEKKAEELKNRPNSENPSKRFKSSTSSTAECQKDMFNFKPKTTTTTSTRMVQDEEDDINLDDIEDFEDKLFDWRSKGL